MGQNFSIVLAFAAGAVIAGVGLPYINNASSTGGLDADKVKAIVRDVIKQEPRLIVESVQSLQNKDRNDRVAKASDALKNADVKKALFYDNDSPYTGPKDSKKVVVEFFDYNCPACKVQFGTLSDVAKKHTDVKIVFKEYPIFGPQSDVNAQIALAVNRIDRTKYFTFHEKMMKHQGRVNEAQALKFVTEIGLDAKKVKAESETDAVKAILSKHRDLGAKIIVQGTPTVVVGDKVFPHAVSMQDIRSGLNL
jgi:protein-disulfide isomerase